jgi:hypothetical protein
MTALRIFFFLSVTRSFLHIRLPTGCGAKVFFEKLQNSRSLCPSSIYTINPNFDEDSQFLRRLLVFCIFSKIYVS